MLYPDFAPSFSLLGDIDTNEKVEERQSLYAAVYTVKKAIGEALSKEKMLHRAALLCSNKV